jgi:hypothetical protein
LKETARAHQPYPLFDGWTFSVDESGPALAQGIALHQPKHGPSPFAHCLHFFVALRFPVVIVSDMTEQETPLQTIETKLATLRTQREALNKEISGLEEVVQILKPIYAEAPSIPPEISMESAADIGITDAVRNALKNAKVLVASGKLTATQVRDLVVSMGFDVSKYSNAMATIHQVLNRLIEADKAGYETVGNLKTTYFWTEPTGQVLQQLMGQGNHPSQMPASSDPLTTPPTRGKVTLKYPSGQKK